MLIIKGGGLCGNRCGIWVCCFIGIGKCVCNLGYYGNLLVVCFLGKCEIKLKVKFLKKGVLYRLIKKNEKKKFKVFFEICF